MFLIIISLIIIIGSATTIWKAIDTRKSELSMIERKQAYAQKLQKEIDDLEAESTAQHEQIEQEEAIIAKENETTSISIRYAEGIQRSLIPSPAKIMKVFPESFVYFEPKDIVSGDFYNMFKLEHFVVIVVADCTGHGVPGGFLSMLGMAGLRDLLPKYYSLSHIPTGEILDKMRDFVISSLKEAVDTDGMEVSDGMDMTMAAIANNRSKITFSLADHNIYLGRNGEIEKLKGNRMPIGRHPNQDQPFEEKTLALQSGDMLYFCSDGVQDQIGGPDDCKYLTKRLAKMLQQHLGKSIEQQRQEISKEINNWKQGYEQVDDQTLIGIRI